MIGPAHAVYFATYEIVKHKLGGNIGNEHHPIAVGMELSFRP
jgi:solute carrier family 25 iron transporter 28/37